MLRALLIAVTFVVAAPAFADDDRMEAYVECWSSVAAKSVPDGLTGKAYEDALGRAVDKANTTCNQLARHAAKTNGKEAVNAMWQYMEVQFFNANLRER